MATKIQVPTGGYTFTKVGGPDTKGGGPKLEKWKPNRPLQATGDSRMPKGFPSQDEAVEGKEE